MKNLKRLAWTVFVFGIFSLAIIPGVNAAGPNLISNPSLETVSNGSPANWQTDTWGTNTPTFTYSTTGYNSSRSAYVSVSGYQSGDSKWYFDPVDVKPNTQYVFTDYYKSNVPTHIVAMSLNGQGTPTYFDVEVNVPAASNWTQYSGVVKTLASTKKLTLFHLVEKNGWLQTDNFSLVEDTPAVITDFVPNGSMETVSPTNAQLPANWKHDKWGTNTARYEYVKSGKVGNRSVKVTVSNYKTGDAKWTYTPQALEPGKDYQFTAWYKTNTIPHVVAQYIKADGSEEFFGLPDPEPVGTDWQQYSGVFPVPAGTQAVSVFFFLSNNGWVQTDDYHVTPYTYVGFNRGIVTLTFDDGFEKNITTAMPVLDQYGFKATQCDATQYVEGNPDTIAIAKKFVDHGHEICSHSVTHPYFTSLTTAQMDYELSHSRDFLQQITGKPVTDFSSPYGDYNTAVNTEIKKYYKSHRTTDEGFNSKDTFNPYRLRVQNMQSNTTLAQFKEWVNKAIADRTWLILIYHVVDTQGLEQFDTAKADFDAQMAWLAQSGATVARWDAALAEVSGQIQ